MQNRTNGFSQYCSPFYGVGEDSGMLYWEHRFEGELGVGSNSLLPSWEAWGISFNPWVLVSSSAKWDNHTPCWTGRTEKKITKEGMVAWLVWRVMLPNSTSGRGWDWADRQLRCSSSPATSVLLFSILDRMDPAALAVILEFPCILCPVAWAGCLLRNLTRTSPLFAWVRGLCSTHTSTALAWWS